MTILASICNIKLDFLFGTCYRVRIMKAIQTYLLVSIQVGLDKKDSVLIVLIALVTHAGLLTTLI